METKSKKTQNVIEQFANLVLATENSFAITQKGKQEIYSFVQRKTNKSRLVYGTKLEDIGNVSASYIPVAVVRENIVYLIDKCFFDISPYDDILPDNVQELPLERENEKFNEQIFPRYIENLHAVTILDKMQIAKLQKLGRAMRLKGVKRLEPSFRYGNKGREMFAREDIVNSLCGLIDLEETAIKRLDEQKEKWIKMKSEQNVINDAYDSMQGIEDWEYSIAQGVRKAKANGKCVRVVFEYNGKRSQGDMNPYLLTDRLDKKSGVSSRDFRDKYEGKALFKKLGAQDRGYDNTRCLTCKHIVSITCDDEVLYKRNEQ